MIGIIFMVVLWVIVFGGIFLFLGASLQYSIFKKQMKAGLTPYIAATDEIEWKQ